MHAIVLDEKRKRPNIRVMLGFAQRILESVKVAEGNLDFIAEQNHFKQRNSAFWKYFVVGREPDYAKPKFIK
jgi:hypothetical protein